jgi:hypothetical protein
VNNKISLTITIIFLFIVLSLSYGGCTSPKPSQFLTYTDKANGFSIDYPKGWYIKHPKKPPQLKVAIYSKKYGISPVGILVGKYNALGYDVKSFSKNRIKYLANNTQNFNSISTEEITINGRKAIKHVFTSKVGRTSYKSMEIYLVENGKGWIIRFTSPQKTFDSYKFVFNTSLNSFKLI